MSATPLDDRIQARAQLEHVANALYADPTAALRAMRRDAHVEGAEVVGTKLEADFRQYGQPRAFLHGPAGERAQETIRIAGVAADVQKWLTIDHAPPEPEFVDSEIERAMQRPDAAALGRNFGTNDPQPADPRDTLNPDERIAYEQLDAYAAARERAAQRQAAEARLHAIADHRENLQAAEASVPEAKSALNREVEETFGDDRKSRGRRAGRPSPSEMIEAAIEADGPAETARRIRSGELLGKQQRPIPSQSRFLGVFTRRDTAAERDARERVAQRVETVGYYEGDLGKWCRFEPRDGPPVTGVRNVRAALDREEARIYGESDLSPARREMAKNRPPAPHPSREASQLGNAARRHLERLSPESRERIAGVAARAGADRITAALGHLQTIQMAARTFREGLEPPGY